MLKSYFSVAASGRELRGAARHLAAFGIAFCAAAAAFSPASGQSDQGYVPRREGNVYDHKPHQPTTLDLCPRGVEPSLNCPSASTRRLIEDEVQRLLRESDLDSGFARQRRDHPKGNAPWNTGGR